VEVSIKLPLSGDAQKDADFQRNLFGLKPYPRAAGEMSAKDVLYTLGPEALFDWPLPVLARHGYTSSRDLLRTLEARMPSFMPLMRGQPHSRMFAEIVTHAYSHDPVISMAMLAVVDLALDLGFCLDGSNDEEIGQHLRLVPP